MERQKDRRIIDPYRFITAIYAVGIIGHLIEPLTDVMGFLTPFVLLITGLVVLYYTDKESAGNIFFWALSVYVLTYFIEVIGVKTGAIFGEYYYTDALGFRLLEAPLIIGFNWTLVILGCAALAERFSENFVLFVLSVGLLAVIFDFILEPAAFGLSYWFWAAGTVPLLNYIAWFIIASLAAVSLKMADIRINTLLPAFYAGVQFVFFIILDLKFLFFVN